MRDLELEKFSWGIEHEFPLIKDGQFFCDFSNLTYEALSALINVMPTFATDYPFLRVGDLGIKSKRWYIEGFERFNETGDFLYVVPKGMEIRTPVCTSLEQAVQVLKIDVATWELVAKTAGYTTAAVAFNPVQVSEFIPNPSENPWEINLRAGTAEYRHMLTYGPDINFSHPALATQDIIEIGRKLTYYSPFIVPFSFSSPFFKGELWGGLSRRTYYRTGRRPAVYVFIDGDKSLIKSTPTLTKEARIPKEIGRIEFKAFDAIKDLNLYKALGTLLLGLTLDQTLPGRATVPDEALHQTVAWQGFDNDYIREETTKIIMAVKQALPEDLQPQLEPLEFMLATRQVPAHKMIEVYQETKDVIKAIL